MDYPTNKALKLIKSIDNCNSLNLKLKDYLLKGICSSYVFEKMNKSLNSYFGKLEKRLK